ncbi:unnamed protein product [Orchesella dallaii]|uniref:Uncharacterized protein n=1 Tax=Orchesella dallaii TaxID=48710 RepID=A0ABP1PIE6_9HEXA
MGKLRWIPSSAASSRLSELIPAGREDLTSYIARAFHEGEWISGKFLICFDGVYRAYIPYYGKEYTYTDFQTLIAPPGATTWVETGPKNIPKHAVIGGFDPAVMEPTYICRAWHEGQLVVGKVLRNSENCFIPFHGKELLIDKRFEVLVYNFNEATYFTNYKFQSMPRVYLPAREFDPREEVFQKSVHHGMR